MRKFGRMLLKMLGLIGLIVLLLVVAAACVLWITLPSSEQTLRIPGLSAPVAIAIDADGVPRIQAATELDAAAALGFVHARDRMFQMEMMRRAASGRLSEIAGPSTVPIDRSMRILGLARLALADYPGLPAETKAMLEAYAQGVNAWIAARGRFAAPEFLLLGAPEPWLGSDSLLWGKTMGLWLSLNWRTELSRMALAGTVPQRLIDELWSRDPPSQHAALTPDPVLADAAARLAALLPRFPGAYTQPSSASNEWAVDGQHSATGAPLLAGDPHLAFAFPGLWYLVRIDTPSGTLAGATGPGVPLLVLGHNGRIAWTFTTTGADVQDVFIESAEDAKSLLTREETIGIRGQPPETLTVRESRHGPVISDLDRGSGKILAVAMGNLQPGDTAMTSLLALNRARTVAEAGHAAAMATAPVQTLLVADRRTIGQFVTGRIPIRRAGDGSVPVPGDGTHDWIGWASGNELPHTVAPPSGRLVNANDRIAPPNFPVFLGRDWFGDWRARRIHALLDASEKQTSDGFARMQTDLRSPFAEQILPVLRGVAVSPGVAAKAQALLTGWEGDMTMESPQPLIFNLWVQQFYRLVLRKAGIGLEHGGPIADFVGFVLSPAGAHWCDGDCGPLLRQALDTAVAENSSRFGAEPAQWRWGDAHQAVFAHPMLRALPLLGDLTTLMIASPGDDTTLDRGAPNAREDSVHGASFRGVYDLSDLDRSLFMMAPGQSGHPLRRHARDMLRRWRDGATMTLGREPAAVTATVRLTP